MSAGNSFLGGKCPGSLQSKKAGLTNTSCFQMFSVFRMAFSFMCNGKDVFLFICRKKRRGVQFVKAGGSGERSAL